MKYIYIVLLAFIIVSCSKEMDVKAPDFDVQVEKLAYKVGDTVRFDFSGKAENITFYSGMPGADYEYRDRTQVEGGIPQIEVVTQYGGGGTQINSLRLMVTTELDQLTKEAVLAANWTDITSRAIIAKNATVTQSGPIDVSDILQPGKSLFFALKFVGAQDPNNAGGNWIIPGFNAKYILADGTPLPIANLQNAGWQPFDVINAANTWYSRGTPIVDLVIIGGGKNAPVSEDWYVTRPLNFTKVSPDVGLPIQYIAGNSLSRYDFAGYTRPGTYKATFVGTNVNVDAQKSVVRQLEITITP